MSHSPIRTLASCLMITVVLANTAQARVLQSSQDTADAHLRILDADTKAPVAGAAVHVVEEFLDEDNEGCTLERGGNHPNTDDAGAVVVRRTFGIRGRGANQEDVKCRVCVTAAGYSSQIFVCPSSNGGASAEAVYLSRVDPETWARDSTDRLAAQGHVWQDNLPQDNLTAYPVLRIRVLDMEGRPLEDALVTLAPDRTTTDVSHRTGIFGTCVFSPYDFGYVTQMWQRGRRGILKGTRSLGTIKEEQQTVVVTAVAHGFSASSIHVVMRTLDPAQTRVIRLTPDQSTKALTSSEGVYAGQPQGRPAGWLTRNEQSVFTLRQKASVTIRRPDSTARAVSAEVAHIGIVDSAQPSGYGLWLTLYAFSDPFASREQTNYFDGARHILLGRPRDGSTEITEGKRYRIELNDLIIEYWVSPLSWHAPNNPGESGYFSGTLHTTAIMPPAPGE